MDQLQLSSRLGVWGHGDQGNTVDVSAWEHQKICAQWPLDSKHFLALGDECRIQLRDVTTWPVATLGLRLEGNQQSP